MLIVESLWKTLLWNYAVDWGFVHSSYIGIEVESTDFIQFIQWDIWALSLLSFLNKPKNFER